MMGMFFIFNTQTLSLNQNENTYFTLVYKDKIHFFRIAKNPNKNYLESNICDNKKIKEFVSISFQLYLINELYKDNLITKNEYHKLYSSIKKIY